MSIHVLVVDNAAVLAQEAAHLITVGVPLETAHASDSAAALRLLEENPISVVVLDQRMDPDISGTELFQRMRQIRPTIRAIMLTGEAERDEVGQALELGFSDYLPKGRVRELPDRVLVQYLKSASLNVVEETRQENILLWTKKRWPWSRRREEVKILSWRVLNDRLVDPRDWVTVLQLNAGEERKISHQVVRSTTIVVEEQSQRSLQANAGLKSDAIIEVTTALQSTLAKSLKSTDTSQATDTNGIEQTFRLPAEPAPGVNFVRSRLFQRAPVHRKIILTVAVTCTCCDLQVRVPVVVLQRTGMLATRHEDRLSDHSVVAVETGDIAG